MTFHVSIILQSMFRHSGCLSKLLYSLSGRLTMAVSCRLQEMWSCLPLLRGMTGRGTMHSGFLWGRAPSACTLTSATSSSTSDVPFSVVKERRLSYHQAFDLLTCLVIIVPTAAIGALL